jgi:broad specificity phosphatase PhoE
VRNQGCGKPVERVETSASEELRERVQSLEEMTDEELRELRLKLIVESVEEAALGRDGRSPPPERKQHVRDRLRDCLGELLEADGPVFARVFQQIDEQAK